MAETISSANSCWTSSVLDLIAEAGWGHPETHAGHLVGEFPHGRIDGEERGSYSTHGNRAPLRRVSPSGKARH